ncbi:hypothetical protein GY45DRAFT_862380 [Cubamyces sp. BRFM 1775]|nr:hypothetical protein GY45DRAFT_862380 [Cubamyces sp. BRFM 1775]
MARATFVRRTPDSLLSTPGVSASHARLHLGPPLARCLSLSLFPFLFLQIFLPPRPDDGPRIIHPFPFLPPIHPPFPSSSSSSGSSSRRPLYKANFAYWTRTLPRPVRARACCRYLVAQFRSFTAS